MTTATYKKQEKTEENPVWYSVNNVLQRFGFGRALDSYVMDGGISSNVYNVKTGQGEYVVREIPNFNGNSSRTNLKYAVTDHLLGDESFNYQVPEFQKTSEGERAVNVGGKYFEVYKKIKGDLIWEQSQSQLEEQATSLAHYHNSVKGRDFGHQDVKMNSIEGILGGFSKLKSGEIKIENEYIAKRITENMPIYEEFARQVRENRGSLNGENILLHADYHQGNMVYNGGSLTGILDFDSVKYGPKIFDIACAIPAGKDYEKFLNAYEAVNPLSSQERNAIPLAKATLSLERLKHFAGTPRDGDKQANVFKFISESDKDLQYRLAA